MAAAWTEDVCDDVKLMRLRVVTRTYEVRTLLLGVAVATDKLAALHTLRVHVPKYYILRPQCSYIGTTLRPMYLLYEYMDP